MEKEVVTYRKWSEVPENLKTKTSIPKLGKRRRPRQAIRAYIDTASGRYGMYTSYTT